LLIFQADFLLNFLDCSGAKVCKSCRAWKCCQTHIFLPAKKLQILKKKKIENFKFVKFCHISPQGRRRKPRRRQSRSRRGPLRRSLPQRRRRARARSLSIL